jgi:hypothetical protein
VQKEESLYSGIGTGRGHWVLCLFGLALGTQIVCLGY